MWRMNSMILLRFNIIKGTTNSVNTYNGPVWAVNFHHIDLKGTKFKSPIQIISSLYTVEDSIPTRPFYNEIIYGIVIVTCNRLTFILPHDFDNPDENEEWHWMIDSTIHDNTVRNRTLAFSWQSRMSSRYLNWPATSSNHKIVTLSCRQQQNIIPVQTAQAMIYIPV